jgi:hypothetical protein
MTTINIHDIYADVPLKPDSEPGFIVNEIDHFIGFFKIKSVSAHKEFTAEIDLETGKTKGKSGAGFIEKTSRTPEGETITKTEFYADTLRAKSIITDTMSIQSMSAVNGKLVVSNSGIMTGFKAIAIEYEGGDGPGGWDDLPKERVEYIINIR